jgi:hypothetical protein
MLLELIAQYYKYLWGAFIAFAILKLILAYSFNRGLDGFNGALFAIFQWYSQDQRELEDSDRRKFMQIQNAVTILLFGVILLIVIASLIMSYIPRK